MRVSSFATQPPMRAQTPQAAQSVTLHREISEPLDLASTGAALLGGATTLAGAVIDKPLVMAAGLLATAAGTGIQAYRLKGETSLDKRAALSMVVGGGMAAAGVAIHFLGPALTAAAPEPTNQIVEFLQSLHL